MAKQSIKRVDEDKLADAKRQGQAQFDSIKEMVQELRKHDSCTNGWDEVEKAIHDDALSISVRTGWYSPGATEDMQPEEYEILLCTGGPACRIIGDLDRGQPTSAQIQVQDWFQPWTNYDPIGDDVDEVLREYAGCFYFGE